MDFVLLSSPIYAAVGGRDCEIPLGMSQTWCNSSIQLDIPSHHKLYSQQSVRRERAASYCSNGFLHPVYPKVNPSLHSAPSNALQNLVMFTGKNPKSVHPFDRILKFCFSAPIYTTESCNNFHTIHLIPFTFVYMPLGNRFQVGITPFKWLQQMLMKRLIAGNITKTYWLNSANLAYFDYRQAANKRLTEKIL